MKRILYYALSFLQGVCLMIIPSISVLIKSPETYAITSEEYGLIFLPGIAITIAVNLFFYKLARRFGLKRLFLIGLGAQLIFTGCFQLLRPECVLTQYTFVILAVSSGFFGVAFGLMMSTLNLFIIELNSNRRHTALSTFHALLGLGAALAPILVYLGHKYSTWCDVPLALLLCFSIIALIVVLRGYPHAEGKLAGEVFGEVDVERAFPLGALPFMVSIFLYGLVEAALGNWSVDFLMSERSQTQQIASMALSTFWLAVTVGRFLTRFMARLINERHLYVLSPLMISLAFLVISHSLSPSAVLIGYLLAGLGCSYYVPFTMTLASEVSDIDREKITSSSVAMLMLGVGIGSVATGSLIQHFNLPLRSIFLACIGISLMAFLTSFFAISGSKTAN